MHVYIYIYIYMKAYSKIKLRTKINSHDNTYIKKKKKSTIQNYKLTFLVHITIS